MKWNDFMGLSDKFIGKSHFYQNATHSIDSDCFLLIPGCNKGDML